MTNYELAEKLGHLIRQERKITNEILNLINIALDHRSYLELGYSSMFDWLTKGFGYSNAAAYRRIEAARIMKTMPDVSQKLENGQLNLSTLSKAQSVIKSHERATGERVSAEQKVEAVEKIENISTDQAERVLLDLFPNAAEAHRQEHRRIIDNSTTRASINLSTKAMTALARAKEILSHKFPNASDGEIIAHTLTFFVEATDSSRSPKKPHAESLTRAASAAEAKCVKAEKVNSTAEIRRAIFKRDKGCCTYKDPRTGKICGSRYQVQIDHVIPRALGGGDGAENLRLLCRQHNLLAAEIVFGKPHMRRFRPHG